MCLFFALFFIFGWAFAQEDEILDLKEKIIDLQNKGKLGFSNFTLWSSPVNFCCDGLFKSFSIGTEVSA